MAFFKSVSKPGFRDKVDSETWRKKSDSGEELGPRFALKTSDEVRVGPERVGLVTLEELKAQKEAEERRVAAEERKETAEESSTTKEEDCVERGPISFSYDDTDEEDESNTVNEVNNEKSDDNGLSLPKKKRYGVNPNVDIRFIPDIYRKEEEVKLREELKKEWMEMQIAIKNEEIKFLYSYWDGSGHRKEITVRKGDSIQTFLNKCLEQLRREFPDLKTASADKLMYIKDDLIIPHHNTFYDFIVSKAKGKSGPLFNFEDRANLRIVQGVIMEEDGKICLRSWYERNKHIFPASRWEPYDPIKNWDNCSELDKLSAKIIVK